jgi:Tfp pilus assembly protein PilX
MRKHDRSGVPFASSALNDVSRDERGIAVIVAMMGLMIISGLGVALVLGTSTESMIVRNFKSGAGGVYAADAAVQQALGELAAVSDWSAVLDGSSHSAFADGAPSGERTLADGTRLNLTEILNVANCARLTTCNAADMNAVTAERPWGTNNPWWHLYAYGRIDGEPPSGGVGSRFYVVLLVADDPSEIDGNPSMDALAENPGAGVLLLRSEAFGPAGAHAVVEATLTRTDADELSSIAGAPPIRLAAWRLSH